jgi:copper chaperone NosL
MCNDLTRRHVMGLLSGLAVLPLSGCFEGDQTGPEDIHWDRDSGELCKMMISDARYVAEVRGGPKRKLYKFDDVGCAINWLNEKPWAAASETEIWVADLSSTREKIVWLKARDAHYINGEMTPMNYGYGAVGAAQPGSIDFVEMSTNILADTPNHICATPSKSGS